MTRGERFGTALTLSCFIHWSVFRLLALPLCHDLPGTAAHGVMDSLAAGLPAVSSGTSISMETAPDSGEPSNSADQRRRAFFAYLEAIDEAVHAHRLDGGNHELIGVAVYAFTVRPDGSFSWPVLRQTSNSPPLDAAARKAILAVSGTLKRPPILGHGDIPVLLHVKYQYNLR